MKEWLCRALRAPFPEVEAPSGPHQERSKGGRNIPSSPSWPPPLGPPPQPRFEHSKPQIRTENLKRQKSSWWKVGDVEPCSRLSQRMSCSRHQRASPLKPSLQKSLHPALRWHQHSPPGPQNHGAALEGMGAAPPLPPAHPLTLHFLFRFLFCHLKYGTMMSPDCLETLMLLHWFLFSGPCWCPK